MVGSALAASGCMLLTPGLRPGTTGRGNVLPKKATVKQTTADHRRPPHRRPETRAPAPRLRNLTGLLLRT